LKCYGAEPAVQAQVRRPLEPLTVSEVEQAVALLKSIEGFTASTRIISVMLKEPPKDAVYEWPSAATPDRCAIAVRLDNAANAIFAVSLNLTKSKVIDETGSSRFANRRSPWTSRSNASKPFSPARSFWPR
jgi:Cu2+-containing amine oxidase